MTARVISFAWQKMQRGSLTNWLMGAATAGLLVSVPMGLANAEWLHDSSVLWTSVLLAGLLALGVSRITDRAVPTLSMIALVGVLFVSEHYGQIAPPIRPAIQEVESMFRWAVAETRASLHNATADEEDDLWKHQTSPALPEWQAAVQRIDLYIYNLQVVGPPAPNPSRSASGNILQGSLIAMLCWLVAGLAIWMIAARRWMWRGTASCVGLLAFNTLQSGSGWYELVIALVCGLLLAGGQTLASGLDRWDEGALPYGLPLDWWTWVAVMAGTSAALMLLTIQLTDPEFHELVREFLTPSETAESGDSQAALDAERGPVPGVWPRTHLLGGGPELDEVTVMQVSTLNVPPAHFYWRATTYDQYTGHGWLRNTSPFIGATSDPAPLWTSSVDPPPDHILLRQTFRFENATQQVYAAGRPVRLNQPAQGYWLDSTENLVTVRTFNATAAYEVMSWVPSATPEQLRGASVEYPEWAAAYLVLPEELPEEIGALAEDLTQDASTAYDKMLALQTYLRSIEYTLDLPPLPEDVDVVSHFLFELERGYCDYYASSMVVMARSLGVPARLAAGYSTGTYDTESDSFRVTMLNGHSWPEVYFPGFGWIPFEPTGGVSPLEHGQFEAIEDQVNPEQVEAAFVASTGGEQKIGAGWRWMLLILGGLVAGLALIAGGLVLSDHIKGRRLQRMTPDQQVEILYADLLRWGRRLGALPTRERTPYEFLTALADCFETRTAKLPYWLQHQIGRFRPLADVAKQAIDLYADQCYSARSDPPVQVAWTVVQAWRHCQLSLWMLWLTSRPSR